MIFLEITERGPIHWDFQTIRRFSYKMTLTRVGLNTLSNLILFVLRIKFSMTFLEKSGLHGRALTFHQNFMG